MRLGNQNGILKRSPCGNVRIRTLPTRTRSGFTRTSRWASTGTATACSPPDAVGFAACIQVNQGSANNPWVSVSGDSDVFWETVFLTVDDREPFIGRFAQNGAAWGLAGGAYGRERAARIIEALRAGSRVRVRASAAWDYTISLRGSSAAIDRAMSATWTLEGGWTTDPEQARRDKERERARQETQQRELALALAAAQAAADRAAEVARQEQERREQAEQLRREELQAEREQFVTDILNTTITSGLAGPIGTATGGLPGAIAGLRYSGGYARMSFPAATASQLSRARRSGGYEIVCTTADLSGDEIELREHWRAWEATRRRPRDASQDSRKRSTTGSTASRPASRR